MPPSKASDSHEHAYRDLIRHVPVGFFRTTADAPGCFLLSNASTARLLGFKSPRQLTKVRVIDTYADPRQRRIFIRTMRQHGFARNHEVQLRRKDGSLFWVAITARAVHDDAGRVVYFDGMLQDISDRKRAEAALQQSEERYRLLVETSPEAILVLAEGRVMFANAAAARLHGAKSAARMLGRPAKAILQTAAAQFAEAVATGGRKARVLSLECRLRRVDGRFTDVLAIGMPVTFAGRSAVQVVIHDITDRKRREQELQESEAKYATVINQSSDGIVIMQNGRFVFHNEALRTMTGYSARELSSMPWYKVLTPESRVLARARNRARARGEAVPERYEARLLCRDGTVKDALLNGRIIPFEGGTATFGTIRDVSAETQARRALEEALARLRSLESIINRSPAVVFLWRMAEGWPVDYVSDNVAQFGYTADDFTTGRVSWVGVTHPDDVPRLEQEVGDYVRSGIDEFMQHYRLITRSGEARWIEDRTRAVRDAGGRLTHFQGIILDVTGLHEAEQARKRSEARFRTVFDAAPDFLYLVDPSRRCLYANVSALNQMGLKREELIGRELDDVMGAYPDVVRKWTALIAQVAQTKAPVLTSSRRMYRGRLLITETQVLPVADPDGEIGAIAILSRDVTERQQLLEERQRLSQRVLEVQESERREISAMLHDQLGQLLTLARLDLESIKVGDPKSRAAASRVNERIGEALGTVRRLATSLRPPLLDDLSLDAALETLTDELRKSSGIAVSFEAARPVPRLPQPVATTLYRVLQEALTNIARHAGATKVDVSLEAVGGRISLRVADNGRGFEHDPAGKGAGIGLISMRERVAACGGTFSITSEKDRGTTITLSIALTPATPGLLPGPLAGGS